MLYFVKVKALYGLPVCAFNRSWIIVFVTKIRGVSILCNLKVRTILIQLVRQIVKFTSSIVQILEIPVIQKINYIIIRRSNFKKGHSKLFQVMH